jgi:hypothetical protein
VTIGSAAAAAAAAVATAACRSLFYYHYHSSGSSSSACTMLASTALCCFTSRSGCLRVSGTSASGVLGVTRQRGSALTVGQLRHGALLRSGGAAVAAVFEALAAVAVVEGARTLLVPLCALLLRAVAVGLLLATVLACRWWLLLPHSGAAVALLAVAAVGDSAVYRHSAARSLASFASCNGSIQTVQ